jgi:hypothetical protein
MTEMFEYVNQEMDNFRYWWRLQVIQDNAEF